MSDIILTETRGAGPVRFIQAFSPSFVIADPGGICFLPRLAGIARTRALALAGWRP